MFKRICFSLLTCFMAVTVMADGYTHLKVVSKSGAEKTVKTDRLKITFQNGNIVASNSEGTTTQSLSNTSFMLFTNDGSTTELLRGDINGDSMVDVTDVSCLIDVVLGKAQASDFPGECNLNSDQNIDVTDVSILIDIVLGKILSIL